MIDRNACASWNSRPSVERVLRIAGIALRR
jgi:hypothetical protein